MFKKIKVLYIIFGFILTFNITTKAMQENYKINNEETPLKSKTISYQTQKEIFSNCSKDIYNSFQELKKGENLNWEVLNDIIKLINLTNSETKYLKELEIEQNNIQPNKKPVMLLIQYDKIFKEITEKIKEYINNIEENLNNIKDYERYSNFYFSVSDEEIEEKSKNEEKKEKEKEETIATYKTILKNILNSLNLSYIPMLENLPKLTEKTFFNILRRTPKINDIKPYIKNNIEINKKNLENLKIKINNLSLNLNQIQ